MFILARPSDEIILAERQPGGQPEQNKNPLFDQKNK